MTTPTRRRRGFTLVEILVALALTIFILTILSQCFTAGADTFRTLKAVGDLNASLRVASNIIRSDLSADHFEGKRRLSDSKFWSAGNGPPQLGYFYIEQSVDPALEPAVEGYDVDVLPSRRRVTHKLAFTVKARGNRPENYFTATIPSVQPQMKAMQFGSPDNRFQVAIPGTPPPQYDKLSSQWVEVCYFLAPIPNANTGSAQLYALYRQERLVVTTDNQALNWGPAGPPTQPQPISGVYTSNLQVHFSVCFNTNPAMIPDGIPWHSPIYFNSPEDLSIPERRASVQSPIVVNGRNYLRPGFPSPADRAAGVLPKFMPLVDPYTLQATAEDLLLPDVLSFDVKVLTSVAPTNPAVEGQASSAEFGDLPAPYYFDTWSRRKDDVFDYSNATNSPVPTGTTMRITGLQITIRVYDAKTRLARQITIVQDM
jgi:prepilin-type N-terminal cleavage/methylation domain-containing protein